MNNEQLQSAQDALAQGMPQATQQVTMAGADQPAPAPEAPAPEAPAETPAEAAPADTTAPAEATDGKQGTLEERVAALEKDITALVQLFQQHEGTLRAQDAGLFLALYNLENESVLDVPTDIKTKQDILELGFGVKIRETMDVISKVTGTDKDDKDEDSTATTDSTAPTETTAPAETPADTTAPVDTTTPSAPDDVVTMNSEPSVSTTMEG
nr:MAG TPA: hypothetical protein [Caudoviricetes sp.]